MGLLILFPEQPELADPEVLGSMQEVAHRLYHDFMLCHTLREVQNQQSEVLLWLPNPGKFNPERYETLRHLCAQVVYLRYKVVRDPWKIRFATDFDMLTVERPDILQIAAPCDPDAAAHLIPLFFKRQQGRRT